MKVAASAHQVEITPECLVIAAGGSCDLLLLSFLGEGEKMCSFSEVHFSSRLYQHGLSEGNLTFPDNNMPWVFFVLFWVFFNQRAARKVSEPAENSD